LGTKPTRALYKAKGYTEDWIGKRMRGITGRDELTDGRKRKEVRRGAERFRNG
jgi:DNA-damage-inducible protein D